MGLGTPVIETAVPLFRPSLQAEQAECLGA
jgi:hypothetical protein